MGWVRASDPRREPVAYCEDHDSAATFDLARRCRVTWSVTSEDRSPSPVGDSNRRTVLVVGHCVGDVYARWRIERCEPSAAARQQRHPRLDHETGFSEYRLEFRCCTLGVLEPRPQTPFPNRHDLGDVAWEESPFAGDSRIPHGMVGPAAVARNGPTWSRYSHARPQVA